MKKKSTKLQPVTGRQRTSMTRKALLLLGISLATASYANAQFTEGFESGIPATWTVINGGDANTWTAGAPNGGAHTGTNSANILYDADTAHNDYLITMPIVVTAGVSDRISFWARSRSASFLESINVKISTSGTAETDFTTSLASNVIVPETWVQYSYNLAGYIGQTVYIAVQAISLNKWELYLDDFVSDAALPPPSNDGASGAIALTVNPDYGCGTTTNGTTVGATQSNEGGGNPSCSGTGINDDVWYTFTATHTGHRFVFSNVTTGTMAVALYTGTPGSLTAIASGCNSGTTIDFTGLTAGTQYYTRIFTTTETAATTNFTVCLSSPPPPPANDNASGAIALTVNPDYGCGTTTNGTTVGATQSNEGGGNPSCSGTGINDDVWYTFTATQTGHRFVFSNVTTGTMAVALYTGTPGNLTAVSGACNSGTTINFTGLTAGTQYYARIYTTTATVTTTTNFTVCLGSPPPPPANDNASGAIALTVNPDYNCGTTTNGTTISATQSNEGGGNPSCSGTGINDDVWYTFTATHTGHRFAFTNVTTGTMAVALYTGTPGNLTAVSGACNSGATINFTGLTAGTQYYARIYTTTATVTTITNFTVCLGSPPPPPANDECAGAVNIPVNSGTTCSSVISGTLQSATASAGPASSCGTYDDDVWYSFVATNANHVITLQNIAGSVSDLTYQVLSSCGAATALLCSDPNVNIVTGLTPGNTYYIRVASYTNTGGQSTTFDVCISLPPSPPANDECANAINVPVNPTSTCTSVVSGTLVGATPSAGPASSCGTYDDDVWYSFIATASVHTITLQNLAGSTTDLTFQVLNNCGAATAMVCSDPQNAVVSGLTPGNTYYLRVASYTATVLQTSTFDVCISTQPMTYTSCTTAQASSSSVTAGSVNQQILRVAVVVGGIANPLSVSQLDFNTTGSTNTADIINAKVYYTGSSSTFGTGTPFGSAVVNPNGNFSVTGSQVLAGDATLSTTNYFWLAYDVNCAATAANVLDGQCTSVVVAATAQTPSTTNPTGTRAITAATYTATTNQPSTATVLTGSTDQQVLRVALTGCVGTPVTSITFATTGTTAASDITAAKVYYTPTTTFANTTQFGSTQVNPNGTFTITGSQPLTASPGYFWLVYDISPTATPANVVDASCASAIVNGNTATATTTNPTGTRSIVQALVNDDAPGALLLTVGAGCTGAPYTNVNASQSAGEPVSSCSGTTGTHTVWFKFTAPASGAVRVSTDLGTGGTMTDTRLGLFSAANPAVYGGFSIISCDEDGGSVVINNDVSDPGTYMSVLYATGLTPGVTYYVEVDGFVSSVTGTFCIAVDELSSTMLAASATCASTVQVPEATTTPPAYTGWVPLMDANSKLIALVRNPAGSSVGGYTPAQNINTGAVRQAANGVKYLDRNFRIANSTAGTYDVQLFMLTTEQAALEAADPAATLGNLNITRQTGESACTNNFSSGGTNSLITQSGSGAANGVSWVQFTTPGFSNFFVNAGNTPLPLTLTSFSGKNAGAVNHLNWETADEKNFSHFELQRSADGSSFSKLGIVDAKGAGSYTYTDDQPFEGQNIYRLKMVDRDGKVSLSEAVKLMVKKGNGLSVNVHPNPVNQQLHIGLAGKIDGKAWIHVLDITGKVLQTLSVTGNNMTIDMSSFAAGTYMIRYTDVSHNSVTKISKN